MYLYFIRAGNRGAIKIGIANNIERRVATLQTGNPFKLNVIALIPCDSRQHAAELEKQIHRFFVKQNIRGEWFQGNIDFRKIHQITDVDQTRSSLTKKKSNYKHVKKKKKKKKAHG